MRNGNPLVYLDSGATSQHPTVVLDAEREYYERHNAAAHRGTHLLGEEATEIYEGTRAKMATFLGAASPDEIVFTKSATEGINLVAFALTGSLKPGDEILITEIEHHANLVPWQQLALRTGATLRWFKSDPEGRVEVDPSLVTERTKLVAVTGQSNVTGVIPPVREIGQLAHSVGALFLVDGAQSVPHHPVDVAELDADFLAFSGHKMLGPLGLGVLYGKYALLDALPPYLTGGSMIEVVRMEETTFLPPPAKFEPGVPPVAQAAGLGAAVDYLTELGMENVAAHEQSLTAHALDALREIDGVRILGPAHDREPRRHGRVRRRGRALARRRPGARRARHRDQDRPPLRLAAAPGAALPGLQPGQLLHLQHARRGRRARRRNPVREEVLPGVIPGNGEGGTEQPCRQDVLEGTMQLENMYQEVILDHYRNPHHKGLRDPFDAQVYHVNPTCGDEVTLRVSLKETVDGDPVVEDVSYDALGCSISQASASVMTDLVIGKPVSEAMKIGDAFLELMKSKGQLEPDEDVLDEAVVFAGVSKYPARIKCALLGWMAWKDATAQAIAQSDADGDNA